MQLNEQQKIMPFHWRQMSPDQKSEWCQAAIKAADVNMPVDELAADLDKIVGESGSETIDQAPMHTLAAMVIGMSEPL